METDRVDGLVAKPAIPREDRSAAALDDAWKSSVMIKAECEGYLSDGDMLVENPTLCRTEQGRTGFLFLFELEYNRCTMLC